jgi:HSP20 family molecular chaperone IbpA
MKSPRYSSVTALVRPERDTFLNSVNTLVDDFFNTNFISTSPVQTDLGYPKFNAYRRIPPQTAGCAELVLDVFVPYVQRDDIELEVDEDNNSLSVAVRAHQDKEVKEGDYWVRQIPRSSFRQVFSFDAGYPVSNAKGDLKDGILKIVIPFKNTGAQSSNVRKIKIG